MAQREVKGGGESGDERGRTCPQSSGRGQHSPPAPKAVPRTRRSLQVAGTPVSAVLCPQQGLGGHLSLGVSARALGPLSLLFPSF